MGLVLCLLSKPQVCRTAPGIISLVYTRRRLSISELETVEGPRLWRVASE